MEKIVYEILTERLKQKTQPADGDNLFRAAVSVISETLDKTACGQRRTMLVKMAATVFCMIEKWDQEGRVD